MSLTINENRSVFPIFTPWNYEGPTLLKIICWAGFFFGGWLYHPFNAFRECFTTSHRYSLVVPAENKVPEDPLSQILADFNNPDISGKVHGVYILTNETGLEMAQTFPIPVPSAHWSSTIHIGCAAWHNLDIICMRHSDYGLIVDFNPQNTAFMQKTFQWIQESESREAFVEKVLHYLNHLKGPERGVFFHPDQKGKLTHRITGELEREGSWLQSDINYEYLREQLILKGRVTTITEDFCNTETFRGIKKALNTQQVKIDTLYLSNMGQFMRSEGQKHSFGRSLNHLLQEETLLIHCPKSSHSNAHLQQACWTGKTILETSRNSFDIFEAVTRPIIPL